MPDSISFEFESLILFDRYVRALERDPGIGMVEFAANQEPAMTHVSVSERFTTLERNLGNILLIPRRLTGRFDARGGPKIATNWRDAHDLVGEQYVKINFHREPGLTPDGEAWAIFAAFAVSQYKITRKLLLQRRGGPAPYPFNLHGEVERIGFMRALEGKAAAMRHIADRLEDGGIANGAELEALLNENVSERKTRLRRIAFRNFAQQWREREEEEYDDRPD